MITSALPSSSSISPRHAASHSLAVAVVVFRSDHAWLARTLASLSAAITHAIDHGLLHAANVTVVDNDAQSTADAAQQLQQLVDDAFSCDSRQLTTPTSAHITHITHDIVRPLSNRGYGAGNNCALLHSTSDYVLVLNPDVAMAPASLANAINYLAQHVACGMVDTSGNVSRW
ncbi:MAG: glycosyltransferase [Gammaproteobacteria bacterium]|nr:glycosyltransferase [Gammaproteobacteria bacterium]